MVLSQEAEIGLARSLQHPEVETISLRDDPLLFIAHPRAARNARGERGSKKWRAGR